MKNWQCPICGRKRETIDSIVVAICNACIEEMEVEDGATN